MFRVIIADDENRIVKMLAASIPWTKLGLSIASFASDGMEALRLAEEKKADIIITDIRMPGLNGLELCEKLHEANPNIQIILISGYADFSYAQRAIQLGVLGYCLDQLHSESKPRISTLRMIPWKLGFLEASCSPSAGNR